MLKYFIKLKYFDLKLNINILKYLQYSILKIIYHLYIGQYFPTYKEKSPLKILEKFIIIMEKMIL